MQALLGTEGNNGMVSLLKLKDAVRRLLPADSIPRSVTTSEPDTLPLAEALSKFKVFDSLMTMLLSA